MTKEKSSSIQQLIQLFREEKYFELHDELEILWTNYDLQENTLKGKTTKHKLQAVIQLSVALHHLKNENLKGCEILLQKASSKLEKSICNQLSAKTEIENFLNDLL
ncbi:MAG: DUF309 domain-containing protein [Candidatus Caenarcaniphilales bacterium]|nr:DUF309 domain-containing protein [Candidatus Caenarcaniphilales bacterium]